MRALSLLLVCPRLSLSRSTKRGQPCPLGPPPLSLHPDTSGCLCQPHVQDPSPAPFASCSPVGLCWDWRNHIPVEIGVSGLCQWCPPKHSSHSLCPPREGSSQQHPGQRSLGQKPGCLEGEWGDGGGRCWGVPHCGVRAPFPPTLGEIQADLGGSVTRAGPQAISLPLDMLLPCRCWFWDAVFGGAGL